MAATGSKGGTSSSGSLGDGGRWPAHRCSVRAREIAKKKVNSGRKRRRKRKEKEKKKKKKKINKNLENFKKLGKIFGNFFGA